MTEGNFSGENGSYMSPEMILGDSWEVRRAGAGCRRATRASSGENGFDTFPPICGRAHTQIDSLLIQI